MKKLTVEKNSFYLNGEPFRIVAGAMHYFRVPREYWRDRLLKIKACGCNAVETYTAWNLHEPREGEFCFEGNLDLKAYLELINELDMLAIVRPGPYIYSEWEFGGFPWWLLKYDDIELRCSQPLFMSKVESYFDRLIPIIASQQTDCGGAMCMVQVENEYGSYGSDSKYIRALADLLHSNGISCILFTSDGASNTMLSGGSVPELLATCNFGSKADDNFKTLKKFRKKDEPLMCAEYWNGWFDHWSEKHHRRSAEDAAKNLAQILDNHASVSIYMMHGGTNFGWMNGANCYEEYQPTVNSYDDDAPINEYGGLTEKYYAIREVLASHGHVNHVEPEQSLSCASYGVVEFDSCADLMDFIPTLSQEPVQNVTPLPMEKIGQGYGLICYRTKISGPKDKETLYMTVHDRAYVFLDDKLIGIYYRNDKKQKLDFSVPSIGAELTILVENMGRVNYGPALADRKGIIGGVRLGQQFLYHWTHYPLPLGDLSLIPFDKRRKLKYDKRPTFLHAELSIEGDPKDTFVALPGFTKGLIFINGRLLSRYWKEGPQQTAYLPATWLHSGSNEVVVLELEGFRKPQIEFRDTPDIG